MATIKRVGIRSVTRVFAALYAIIGAIIGAIWAAALLIGAAAGQSGWLALGALAVLIAAPVGYSLLGALGGALMAALYNLVADRFGGIEIDLSR